MPVIEMVHDVDPAKVLWDKLGDISEIEVGNNMVLLAVYVHEGKTKGGILTPLPTHTEAKYQGKVCLVVGIGPCVNPEGKEIVRGFEINPGDWVVVNASDGLSMNIGSHRNDVMVRLVPESAIHMRVPRPDCAW